MSEKRKYEKDSSGKGNTFKRKTLKNDNSEKEKSQITKLENQPSEKDSSGTGKIFKGEL